jgi:hypothetical protein
MLTPAEIHQQHKQKADHAREAFHEVLGPKPKRKMTVGKHEAQNYVNLKNVIAEADEKCPKAADTIRWILWHDVLEADRMAFLTEHFEEK